jgi:hypothetical protein
MVQAGSGLKPSLTLQEAREEVARAEAALAEAQRIHDAAKEQLERELKMNTEQLTKEELLKTVQEEVRIRSRAFSGVRAWMLACVRVCMRDA